MIKLRWSTDAEADVDNLTNYIFKRNPLAAISMRDEIETRVQHLKTHPEGWKQGRAKGTREMVLTGTPYIAVYHVSAHEVEIIRILHAKQKWPPE
jgi:toxin ParE1/3/4